MAKKKLSPEISALMEAAKLHAETAGRPFTLRDHVLLATFKGDVTKPVLVSGYRGDYNKDFRKTKTVAARHLREGGPYRDLVGAVFAPSTKGAIPTWGIGVTPVEDRVEEPSWEEHTEEAQSILKRIAILRGDDAAKLYLHERRATLRRLAKAGKPAREMAELLIEPFESTAQQKVLEVEKLEQKIADLREEQDRRFKLIEARLNDQTETA